VIIGKLNAIAAFLGNDVHCLFEKLSANALSTILDPDLCGSLARILFGR
jgi:hypothetical protein